MTTAFYDFSEKNILDHNSCVLSHHVFLVNNMLSNAVSCKHKLKINTYKQSLCIELVYMLVIILNTACITVIVLYLKLQRAEQTATKRTAN